MQQESSLLGEAIIFRDDHFIAPVLSVSIEALFSIPALLKRDKSLYKAASLGDKNSLIVDSKLSSSESTSRCFVILTTEFKRSFCKITSATDSIPINLSNYLILGQTLCKINHDLQHLTVN